MKTTKTKLRKVYKRRMAQKYFLRVTQRINKGIREGEDLPRLFKMLRVRNLMQV